MRLRKKPRAAFICGTPIGADPDCIVDANSRYSIGDYPERHYDNPVTLTQREADLIALANPGAKPPSVLETMHPWLPPRKYTGNAQHNYVQLLALIRRYGKHLFAADDFCNQGWNTICNAIGMISSLDARFYSAWHLPLQDAYILEETRPDYSVIAIDFNAMYAACMQYLFPHPGRLKTVRYDRLLKGNEVLPPGLFRCQLGGTISPFIRRYSPFRHFFSGRYLGAALDGGIEIDLNEFEIAFYRRHFSQIHLVDGVVSDRTVNHPLAREAQRAHARRLNDKAQSNKPLADREKFRMTLMASCANRPRKQKCLFPNLEGALAYLRANYGVSPHAGEPIPAFCLWLSGKKGISLRRHVDGVELVAPDLQSASACFSLSQRIIARSRTLMLEKMEALASKWPGLELCYCNIDSIHFSVPDTLLATVRAYLQGQASREMGGFKIESITKHGLWLEPGRYWLYTSTVEKFSNLGISDGTHPFNERKIYVATREIDGLSIPIRTAIDMAGSSSDAKTAVSDAVVPLTRLRPVEITQETDYMAILAILKKNRRDTVPIKLDAFRQLAQRLGSP